MPVAGAATFDVLLRAIRGERLKPRAAAPAGPALHGPALLRQPAHGAGTRREPKPDAAIERLWRTVKYELIYLGDYADGMALWTALEEYFAYNHARRHQALGYRPPAELYPPAAPGKRTRKKAY